MAVVDKSAFASKNGDVPFLPSHGFALTANDQTSYEPGIAVFAGGGGIVPCVPSRGDGSTVVQVTVPAGGMVPFRCRVVLLTNLTASLLIGVL